MSDITVERWSSTGANRIHGCVDHIVFPETMTLREFQSYVSDNLTYNWVVFRPQKRMDSLGQKCGEKKIESKSNRSELQEVVEAAIAGNPVRLEIVDFEPLLKIRDVESGEVHNFDRLGEFYTWLGGLKIGYARGASDHGGLRL